MSQTVPLFNNPHPKATKDVKRPPLHYFGGKWILAPWVIENMPSHRTYVEPFGGGAGVLLRKPPPQGMRFITTWTTRLSVSFGYCKTP